ncbi:MAG: group II intron reverse transcriptase/maturase [Anaerolineae bacterium]
MFLPRWLGRFRPRRLKPSAKPISPLGLRWLRRTSQPGHPAFTQEALRRAWRQVRANGGGPGVDGVDIAAFEADLEAQLASLRQELTQGTYRPRAVRRVLVPKPREGLRPLAIWALRDRVAQRAVYDYLEPFFEAGFLDCSHGFRPGRSVETAVAAVLVARDAGLRWVLDADIKDCFDSIDPRLLMGMVRRRVKDKVILRLLEAWLQARILTADGHARAAGTTQGGVLSPLLCNVYLHPFDVALTRQGLRLVRYADDLVVLCRRRQEALAAGQAAQHALAPLRLELNPYKTRVVHFDQGFKFLGVFFLRNEHFWL